MFTKTQKTLANIAITTMRIDEVNRKDHRAVTTAVNKIASRPQFDKLTTYAIEDVIDRLTHFKSTKK